MWGGLCDAAGGRSLLGSYTDCECAAEVLILSLKKGFAKQNLSSSYLMRYKVSVQPKLLRTDFLTFRSQDGGRRFISSGF